jgi:hypothetical protein
MYLVLFYIYLPGTKYDGLGKVIHSDTFHEQYGICAKQNFLIITVMIKIVMF